ncbi:MAG: peptidoglycan-associated lipoprotein Pal [Alphaproteobacteria bacterium]|nr:MAG: peptidoglycan-associated lipoprotein Pal [Alphaproteobacteria bacterium]
MNLVQSSKLVAMLAGVMMLAACAGGSDTNTGPVDTGPSYAAGSQEAFLDAVGARGDHVYFAFNRYDLNGQAQAALGQQAAWLMQNPSATVRVAGNCDERGTREYNLALGARRANSVKDYLVSLGVDPSRVETISYGKERPECIASNEECWAINRNGVTSVTNGPSS